MGIAFSTALAHPASAAPLPIVPSVPAVHSAPNAVPVMGSGGSVPTSALAAVPAAAPTAAGPLPSRALAALPAASSPLTNMVTSLTVTVVGTLPAPALLGGLGALPNSMGSESSVGPRVLASTAARIDPVRSEPVSSLRSPPTPLRTPNSPTPVLPRYPSPISPLAANDSSGFSLPSQGNSPFGALPPSSLLLPALAVGGLLVGRVKRPQLLLDARCSPPG
jgi:hypothetical protein